LELFQVSYNENLDPILRRTLLNSIHRSVYRAQIRPGREAAALSHFNSLAESFPLGHTTGNLMTISLFRWGVHLFAYWESIGQAITPRALFGDMSALLESWPGAETLRSFVPMLDIFHWQEPADVEHWQRKAPIDRISGRLARLNPAQASSYIFYHYQLQEERPGSVDKYGQISLHENLIFFYQELPAIVEEPAIKGCLTTTNTPDHWHDVMFPHFVLWGNVAPGQEIWREVELVFNRSA
jgi:hypothetical protein